MLMNSGPKQLTMQDLGSTGFNIEAPIHGDVTIGIWLGGLKRDRDVPALAYQFHTAMLDEDQVLFTCSNSGSLQSMQSAYAFLCTLGARA